AIIHKRELTTYSIQIYRTQGQQTDDDHEYEQRSVGCKLVAPRPGTCACKHIKPFAVLKRQSKGERCCESVHDYEQDFDCRNDPTRCPSRNTNSTRIDKSSWFFSSH